MRPALLALALALHVPDAAATAFRPLRFDDDVAAQRGACGDGDRIACWKARPVAPDLRLSLGGEARWRYEYTGNPGFGADPQDPWGAWLQRYSVFADLRAGARWRGFAQLGAARAHGRADGPSPVDENRLDPTNLFVEWLGDGDRTGLRAGIQEMRLGSARLIDVRDGTNVRRSFEGLRGHARSGAWRLDAFAVAPRRTRAGRFDDGRSSTQALRGLYATRADHGTGWDLYLLHHEDRAARVVQGVAHERRWSAGARAFGERGGWDWNWEAVLQGGRFGDAGIRAWTLATETGYTADAAYRPRLALLSAVASGDADPGDRRLGTFNPMYPRGNYFGEEATLGPRNVVNLQPVLSLTPSPTVGLEASLDVFWRHRTGDGVYAPSGLPVRGPGDSRARHVATIASFGATWTPAPHWSSGAVLAYLHPGRFLRETGPHAPLRYVELTLHYRF